MCGFKTHARQFKSLVVCCYVKVNSTLLVRVLSGIYKSVCVFSEINTSSYVCNELQAYDVCVEFMCNVGLPSATECGMKA